ncbi:AbrB/MazE/SpoVT family DNA-binding domain-containing protein [Candidatus Fermentibacteria bacterium]|nr:AbrB/MazE/SpoVT family DNA-binding domain-containing protein [Candidatus Fermentibacteria bacterium]
MSVATVSSKGQITLPAGLRRAVGIEPHRHVMIQVEQDWLVIRPLKSLKDLAGFAGAARPASEERQGMLDAVAAHKDRGE